MRFRLMTYNIHKGNGGVDRRYRFERIIETLSLHVQPSRRAALPHGRYERLLGLYPDSRQLPI